MRPSLKRKSSHGRSKYCSKGAGENEHMLCAFLLAQSREQSSCTDRVHKLCTQPLPRRASTYHADYMNWRLTCPTPMADVIQPYCTRCQSVVTLTRCKHDVLRCRHEQAPSPRTLAKSPSPCSLRKRCEQPSLSQSGFGMRDAILTPCSSPSRQSSHM